MASFSVGQVITRDGRRGIVIRVVHGNPPLVTARFPGWMTITFRAF